MQQILRRRGVVTNQKTKKPLKSGFGCAGEDLNLHGSRHMALNHACLPIPAPAREQEYYNRTCRNVKIKEDIWGLSVILL